MTRVQARRLQQDPEHCHTKGEHATLSPCCVQLDCRICKKTLSVRRWGGPHPPLSARPKKSISCESHPTTLAKNAGPRHGFTCVLSLRCAGLGHAPTFALLRCLTQRPTRRESLEEKPSSPTSCQQRLVVIDTLHALECPNLVFLVAGRVGHCSDDPWPPVHVKDAPRSHGWHRHHERRQCHPSRNRCSAPCSEVHARAGSITGRGSRRRDNVSHYPGRRNACRRRAVHISWHASDCDSQGVPPGAGGSA